MEGIGLWRPLQEGRPTGGVMDDRDTGPRRHHIVWMLSYGVMAARVFCLFCSVESNSPEVTVTVNKYTIYIPRHNPYGNTYGNGIALCQHALFATVCRTIMITLDFIFVC